MPPVAHDNPISAALLRFHRATDSRQSVAAAWRAHDAWRDARLERDERLQTTDADAGDVTQAAAAIHLTLWNAIQEDYCWTRAVFNFNQLPANMPRPGAAMPPRSFTDRLRASTIGMLVGALGKGVAFVVSVAALPTVALTRRAFDYLLHYAQLGVPSPHPEGPEVADCLRRDALREWLDARRLPLEPPVGNCLPPALSEATPQARAAAAAAWQSASPKLHFGGMTPALLAEGDNRYGVLLPALERHLNIDALTELMAPSVTLAQVNQRELFVPKAFCDTQAGPRWRVELFCVPASEEHGLQPCLEAHCSVVLPVGRTAPRKFGSKDKQPTPLRVPVKISAHVRLTAIGHTLDADVEALQLKIEHEPDHPLWFPRRTPPWGVSPHVLGARTPQTPEGAEPPARPSLPRRR